MLPGRIDPKLLQELMPVAAVVGVLLVVAVLVALVRRRKTRRFPYRLRDGFLSPAEASFYKVLRLAVREEFTICPKVRLADLFFATDGQVSSLNRIACKHVDYVLCEPATMRPVLGLELDDSSHRASNRVERDEFVDGVFRAAGLPLVRVPVQRSYHPERLAEVVAEALQEKPRREVAIGCQEEISPLCPRCDIPMILRTAHRGENRGRQFYGCASYPECRETTDVL